MQALEYSLEHLSTHRIVMLADSRRELTNSSPAAFLNQNAVRRRIQLPNIIHRISWAKASAVEGTNFRANLIDRGIV